LPQQSFTYETKVPTLDLRIQAQGGPSVDLSGTVKSGATHTMLSIEHAEALGLKKSDLHEAGKARTIGDREVPYFTAGVTMTGQVLLASPGETPALWGPSFPIEPIFIQNTDPLWGQEDFFRQFEVTFMHYLPVSTFILRY
jgi:hypothetical protein